jgi:uncharacterized protein (TIGR03437 family)
MGPCHVTPDYREIATRRNRNSIFSVIPLFFCLFSGTAAASTVSLQLASPVIQFGTPATITAIVSPPSAGGNVTFYSGTAPLATLTISNGTAVLTTSMLPAGTNALTARYSGDGANSAARSLSTTEIVTTVAAGGFIWKQINSQFTQASAVAGDFNRDGKQDFAAVEPQCGCVAIYLGNGDGSFTPGTVLKSDSPANPLTGPAVAADFDGDGNVDLAVSEVSANQIAIFRGNGDGTFTASSGFAVSNPISLAIADFNNDGIPDIACVTGSVQSGSTFVGRVNILIGSGSGTFTSSASIDIPSAPLMTAGDFDGDGNADLAVTGGRQGNGDIRILWGKGDGTFSVAVLGKVQFIESQYSMATGDFNGDGIDDFAIDLVSSSAPHLDVYTGNKGRNPGLVSTANVTSQFLTPGDFNGDGSLDLAFAGGILFGNGDGTFHPATNRNLSFLPGGSTWAISGEFNGDGIEDLQYLGNGSTSLLGVARVDYTPTILRTANLYQGQTDAAYTVTVNNLGPSQNSEPVTLQAGGFGATITSATGDGWGCSTRTGVTCSHAGPIAPGAAFPPLSLVVNVSPTAPQVLDFEVNLSNIGDIDSSNDGATDKSAVQLLQSIMFGTLADRALSGAPFTVLASASSGLAVAFIAAGNCVVAGTQVTTAAPGKCSLTASQTGNTEYLPAASVTRSFQILSAATAVTLTVSSTTSILGARITLTATADAGATGRVAFCDSGVLLGSAGLTGGVAILSIPLQATGKRTFTARYGGDAAFPPAVSSAVFHVVNSAPNFGYQTSTPYSGNGFSPQSADFDGDGIPDLAVPQPSGVGVLRGKGDGTFGSLIVTTVSGGRILSFLPGDIDQDGNVDLVAVFQPQTGGAILVVLPGRGDGTFGAILKSDAISTDGLVAIADMNHDGFPDVVSLNGSAFAVSIRLNNRQGAFESPLSWPIVPPNGSSSSFGSFYLALGDVNNDGNPDIVALSAYFASGNVEYQSRITVLIGNGDGTLQPMPVVTVPTTPGPISLGDLDSDGNADLVIGSGQLNVLPGDGAGHFGTSVAFAAIEPFLTGVSPGNPQYVLTGDFNGDGIVDVAESFGVLAGASVVVEIFAGKGDGTLLLPRVFTVGAFSFNTSGLLAMDFNGDGKVDFLANGGLMLGAGTSLLDVTVLPPPPLVQGQLRATYTLVVRNDGTAPTSGTAWASFAAGPYGHADAGTGSGDGWTCRSISCSRNDALAPGAAYPPITASAEIHAGAGQGVTTRTVVYGGGSPGMEVDTAVTVKAPPDPATCTYSVGAIRTRYGSSGSKGETFPIVAPLGCNWEFDPAMSWVQIIDGRSGSGNGAMIFNVLPNTTNASRTGFFGGTKSIDITQDAGPPGAAPSLDWVMNAFTNVPDIAPNTWIVLKGANLAHPGDARVWQDSDFVNGRLPDQLNGVSVTVNGKSAFLYYVNPTQLNVLAPTDPLTGDIKVQVKVDSQFSNTMLVPSHVVSPSFFELVSSAGIHYVYGRHLDYSLIGPLALYPGFTTPVRPGETILVAMTGLVNQSGSVPGDLPVIAIGGSRATVLAPPALIAPGTYQINLVVPNDVPDGDQVLSATFAGSVTQTDLLISVQQ